VQEPVRGTSAHARTRRLFPHFVVVILLLLVIIISFFLSQSISFGELMMFLTELRTINAPRAKKKKKRL